MTFHGGRWTSLARATLVATSLGALWATEAAAFDPGSIKTVAQCRQAGGSSTQKLVAEIKCFQESLSWLNDLAQRANALDCIVESVRGKAVQTPDFPKFQDPLGAEPRPLRCWTPASPVMMMRLKIPVLVEGGECSRHYIKARESAENFEKLVCISRVETTFGPNVQQAYKDYGAAFSAYGACFDRALQSPGLSSARIVDFYKVRSRADLLAKRKIAVENYRKYEQQHVPMYDALEKACVRSVRELAERDRAYYNRNRLDLHCKDPSERIIRTEDICSF